MRRLLPYVCRRSASFNYFLKLDLAKLNGRTKGRHHPSLSFIRAGFAFDMTVFCWRALRSLSRAEKLGRQGAPRERERLTMKILSRPRLEHRLDRDMRPRRNLVAERRVGIVHLACSVALGRKLAEHVARRRSRRSDEVGREGAQLRVVARLERRQRLDVEALHFGQREGGLRGASVFDDRLHFVVERFPCFERDYA